MDYAKELKDLLRPLRIYDLDSGVGAAELDCIGSAMDGIFDVLEQAETDMNPLTATASRLRKWELLLPFVPASLTAEDRRGAVAALLRIDDCSFTCAGINRTLAGCGIPAEVTETDTPMTVGVSFPANRGVPEGFDELQARIEQILPCHLAVEYIFIFCKWHELETLFSTWQALDSRTLAWDALQRLGGDGT